MLTDGRYFFLIFFFYLFRYLFFSKCLGRLGGWLSTTP